LNDTTSLAQKIQQAVNSGTQPDIAINDLLTQPPQFPGPIQTAVIDVADLLAGLPDVYRIAALLPGLPIGQWLPKQDFLTPIFANGVVNLVSVAFSVDTKTKKLVRIALALTLGKAGAGLPLATDILSATVTTLDVTLYPDAPSLTVITIGGSLTINNKLTLDAALSCPSIAFACGIPPGKTVAFSDLIGAFGLDCPSALQPLVLQQLELDFAVRDRSAYLQAAVATANGQPLPIVDGLGLDSLTMELNHAPSGTDVVVGAELTVFKTIVLGVLVTGGTGQPWTIAGKMNVAATAANLKKSQVTVADLISTVLNVSLPSGLNFLSGIAITVLDGKVTLAQPTAWSLDLGVKVAWDLAGAGSAAAIMADTTVKVGNDGKSKTGSIKADLRIGSDTGPGLSMQVAYDCSTNGNNTLAVTLPQLQTTATYNLGDGTLKATFDGRSIGELIGDVAEIFTGNPYVVLPPPWSDVLNAIKLPTTNLAVNLKTKLVTITYTTNIDFFGNTITGIGLSYDPGKPAGQRLLFTVSGNLPVLGDKASNPSWDPTKPGAAPAVPGAGSKLIDIQLVAAGQHVKIAVDNSSTVESTLKQITDIANSVGGSDPNKLPTFDPTAGWLIGTHIVFKSAVDFQFVFADPVIYGAVVTVTQKDDSPPALKALNGLYAEILYRKVSSSIGVYEGMLTLPDAIRVIDYGAFVLQLPSISVDIYTNGDFLIDVGFPHNGDFSHSAMINAGEYVGAGGVYYGHLSGATASALPPVPVVGGRPIGIFNTVTEIGIGLRVGIAKSYSEGPLSASFSLVIQAIFEGIFSTYTQLPPITYDQYKGSQEYYKIVASLGIVGQLQGTIDFVIVTASLLVEIDVIATVQAESFKAVQVEAEVHVEVQLTVKINCGLFSIHVHCSFSAQVSFHTQFGSDTAVLPWSQPAQTAVRAARFGRLMMAAAPGLALSFNKPPCQNVAMTLYVVPQLSRSLTNIANPAGAVDWVYTLQLALPVSSPPGPPPGFAEFAKFITAWAVDAAWKHTGSPTTADQLYASLTIDVSKIDDLVDALKAMLKATQTDAVAAGKLDAALNDFFAQNRFTLGTVSADDMQLGFFPLLPAALTLSGGGGAVIPGLDGVASSVLRAYAVMVATSVLNSVKKANAAATAPLTLQAAYGAPSFSITDAVGMASRFMLHGTRHQGPSATLQPLYRATGQDMSIDLNASALSVTVAGPNAAAWGVTVPPGGLTLSSSDKQNLLHAQADINAYVTAVTTTSVVAGPMPSTVKAPARFAVKQGVDAALSVRALPRALMAWAGTPAQFALYAKNDANGNPVVVPPAAWSWCSTIDFRVQKIPDKSTPGAFLPDVYALIAVRSDGLDRLEEIYKACNGTPNFGTLEIVYGVDANQIVYNANQPNGTAPSQPPTFVTVYPAQTPPQVFLFQSNISTETNPPRVAQLMARVFAAAATPTVDPRLTFLGRLMTGGLTNSGGYYLYLKLASPLPATMFDSRGMTWLTLAVSGFTGGSNTVAPYFNALRIANQTYAGAAELTLRSAAVQAPQSTIAPGFVGVQVSRPDWANEVVTNYQRSLDGLFNLIDCEPASLVPATGGPSWTIVPGAGHVVGPIRLSTQAATDTTHYYRAQFDLLAAIGQAPDSYPSAPTDAANPYQFVGASLRLGYSWIDFYGHTLPPGFTGADLPIGLVDPLLGLDDWPGLSYGFGVTGGASAPQLTVNMTYIPKVKGSHIDEVTYRQYVKIYHQLKAATVTAEASFVKAGQTIAAAANAATVLRANIATILGATDITTLTALTFPLPTPVSGQTYNDLLLQPLTASLKFVRPGPVAAGLEVTGDNPILVKRTTLAPFQDPGAQPAGYRQFATNLETTLGGLGFRVMAGDTDVPGGARFWLLRWQGQGLKVALQAGGTGFAPTPIATALQSRDDIEQGLFTQTYTFPTGYFDKKPNWPLAASNMDMDAVLSDVLTAIESFLSPEYAIPAAIAVPDQVDACIAHKQTLAQALKNRVVPLSTNNADADAAQTKYLEACLLDLRNYYAVDAAAGLNLAVTAPQTPPDLIVYGHFNLPQGSNVAVSAGQSRINPNGANSPLTSAMALSLSARHKDWQATFTLPDTFRVEALELVDGTINVIDPDEPSGQSRKYVTGTWLRFVTDTDIDLTLPSPPTIPLPLRSYPPMPTLSAQGYSQTGGTDLQSVKSWSLDCTYRHQFAAQDTVHITAVLNEPPPSLRRMAFMRSIDLLDGLTLFQALYPSIRATFDSKLRLKAGMPALDQDTLAAITTFVVLVQCIAENPSYVATGASPDGGPDGSKFELVEFFPQGADPATAAWQAKLTKTADPTGMCPPPIVVVDQTPAGQPPSTATLYRGVPAPDNSKSNVYNIASFVNGAGQALTALAALGNPNRTLQVRPLDIVDWHNGRYYLQIVRNQSMPIQFQYVTAVVAAKDRVQPFIDHGDANVDLTTLPTITYGSGGPAPNSFGDFLARLYYALLNGKTAHPLRPDGGMRTEISLSYPLIPDAPANARLPNVRVPVRLQLVPQPPFMFYPSPDQAWTMAQALAGNVTDWVKGNVDPSQRPDLYKSAQLDIAVTVFSAASESSLPMIYLDGLYVKCTALKG
jgi:hypothetical protein